MDSSVVEKTLSADCDDHKGSNSIFIAFFQHRQYPHLSFCSLPHATTKVKCKLPISTSSQARSSSPTFHRPKNMLTSTIAMKTDIPLPLPQSESARPLPGLSTPTMTFPVPSTCAHSPVLSLYCPDCIRTYNEIRANVVRVHYDPTIKDLSERMKEMSEMILASDKGVYLLERLRAELGDLRWLMVLRESESKGELEGLEKMELRAEVRDLTGEDSTAGLRAKLTELETWGV